MNYIGFPANKIKISSIIVKNEKQSKTYKTFKNVDKTFSAGLLRKIRIGTVTIPKSVKRAHISVKNIRVYQLKVGWTSTGNMKGVVTIG